MLEGFWLGERIVIEDSETGIFTKNERTMSRYFKNQLIKINDSQLKSSIQEKNAKIEFRHLEFPGLKKKSNSILN